MLSVPLADQQAIAEYIKDKTDREVGVAALTIIDQHVKECAERWDRVILVGKWLGSGIGLLVLDRLVTDVHWAFLKPMVAALAGG